MKLLISILFLFQAVSASATELPVNIRDAKKKLVTKSMSVKTLSPGIAETEHFRVLKSDSDSAVDLDRDLTGTEKTRAGTVMHHLNIARDYFTNVLGSDFVKTHPKINVRIEMARSFNENLHFLPEGKQDEFNNALTVPASGAKALDSVDKWGVEIWFRPVKEIEVDNIVYRAADELDSIDSSVTVAPVVDRAVTELVSQAAISGSFSSVDYMGALSQVLFTIGALEVFPKVVKFATKSIKSETFLDTALIPEVIYHEFAHVALSDFISIRKSTALNEGLANYFAAVINQNAKIAFQNGSASRNMTGYNGEKKDMYHSVLETKAAGQANFVFSYLWRVRTRFAKEFSNGELIADRMIFESRKFIQYGDKPIRNDLVQALRQATDSRKARMLLAEVSVEAGM